MNKGEFGRWLARQWQSPQRKGQRAQQAKPLTALNCLTGDHSILENVASFYVESSLTYLLFLQMGYELGEKADEVEEDDDGAVEVGRVSSPPLPGLQSSLASLHLTNCPLEHLDILGVLISFL